MGIKHKLVNPQQEKSRHEKQRRKMRVKVQVKLFLGFGELTPLASGAKTHQIIAQPQFPRVIRTKPKRDQKKSKTGFYGGSRRTGQG